MCTLNHTVQLFKKSQQFFLKQMQQLEDEQKIQLFFLCVDTWMKNSICGEWLLGPHLLIAASFCAGRESFSFVCLIPAAAATAACLDSHTLSRLCLWERG